MPMTMPLITFGSHQGCRLKLSYRMRATRSSDIQGGSDVRDADTTLVDGRAPRCPGNPVWPGDLSLASSLAGGPGAAVRRLRAGRRRVRCGPWHPRARPARALVGAGPGGADRHGG